MLINDMFFQNIQMDKFCTDKLEIKLKTAERKIVPNIKMWPMNFSSLVRIHVKFQIEINFSCLFQKNNELANPDTLYGLSLRIVAVESGHCMLQQFQQLHNYLNHLLPLNERSMLTTYLEYVNFMSDISKPVYTCVTSRIIDLAAILTGMGKVKWDINHVSFQHSNYIDIMNRVRFFTINS